MIKLKLLPLEAMIYEGIKAGKSVSQITKENTLDSSNVYGRVKKMVQMGALERIGNKRKSYTYVTKPILYEVIEERLTKEDKLPPAEDLILKGIVVVLNEEKAKEAIKLRDTMSRLELAKKLGISKLQLNLWFDTHAQRKSRSEE